MPHRQPAISSSFTPYRSGLPTHVVVDRCGAVARGRAPGVTTHVVVERGVATRVGDRAPGVASHRVFEGPLLRLRQRSVAGQRDDECEDDPHHTTSFRLRFLGANSYCCPASDRSTTSITVLPA